MFEVGSKVTRRMDAPIWGNLYPGDSAIVTAWKNSEKGGDIQLKGYEGTWYASRYFIAEDTKQYKVGDRIRLARDTSGYRDGYKGQTVTITDLKGTEASKPYITFITDDGAHQSAFLDDIEFVASPKREMNSFKEYVRSRATNEVAS